MLFEFHAHKTQSIYGSGSAGEAQKLCGLMNFMRACDRWEFREVQEAHGPVMNIAEEIRRHKEQTK
jgi:hypothetical protein